MSRRWTIQTAGRLSPYMIPVGFLFLAASLSGAGCQTLLDSRHPLGLCGDGIPQPEQGEQCDDGNTTGGDKCSATCQIEECGNGVPDQGEECDRGVGNDNHGDCTMACKKARCGDGYQKTRGTTPYEVCEDGNSINGDGCNPQCTLRGRVTIIGGTPGGKGMADGIGQAARFAEVRGMVSDGTYVYLSDKESCTIRRMRIDTSEVSTIAGSPGNCKYATNDGLGKNATFSRNRARLALVGDTQSKHLYLNDGVSLRRVDLSDTDFSDTDFEVETCANFPEKVYGITALASDSSDSSVLYVAGHAGLFTVSLSCTCNLLAKSNRCTFQLRAGSMQEEGTADGKGKDARFKQINGLTLDPKAGVLYVADLNRVRKVDLKTWEVKTVAGNGIVGHMDGVGTAARFYSLQDLALHTSAAGKRLYVVEQSMDAQAGSPSGKQGWSNVRRIALSTGKVRTVAGIYGAIIGSGTGERDGFGPTARLLDPWSVALAGDVLYIGEGASIRALALDINLLATAAGVLVQDFTLFNVQAVAFGAGTIYTATYSGDLLARPLSKSLLGRKIGICAPTISNAAHKVSGMVLEGNLLYLADQAVSGVCRIDLSGKQGVLCCKGCKETCEVVYDDPAFLTWEVAGLAKDGDTFYITDRRQGHIYRVDSRAKGNPQRVITGMKTLYPWGIVASGGVLYAAVTESNQVLRIDPQSGATRPMGSGLARTVDGKGAAASFCRPTALATDGKLLFVGESHCAPDPTTGSLQGHAIRQVDLLTEQVTTLVGPGQRPYVVEGTGVWASVNWPAAMAYDHATKALYLADMWDNVVLKVD